MLLEVLELESESECVPFVVEWDDLSDGDDTERQLVSDDNRARLLCGRGDGGLSDSSSDLLRNLRLDMV